MVSIQDQPKPTHNNHPAVWDLVIKDMQDRDKIGRERYGTPLQPFNGRDSLIDAYQEVLDLAVYLRTKIYEEEVKASEEKLRAKLEEMTEGSQPVINVMSDRIKQLEDMVINLAAQVHALEQKHTVFGPGTWQPAQSPTCWDKVLYQTTALDTPIQNNKDGTTGTSTT